MSAEKPLFNHEFGLSQLGGNQALLDKMLLKFIDEFKESVSHIKEAMANDLFSEAKIKVHTVKGISGNLGLQALYACATELDAELRNKLCPAPLLATYEEILNATILLITEQTESVDEHVNLVDTNISAQDGKRELLAKLERNEFIDDETLVELVSSLSIDEASSQRLIKCVEELNYPEAIGIINA